MTWHPVLHAKVKVRSFVTSGGDFLDPVTLPIAYKWLALYHIVSIAIFGSVAPHAFIHLRKLFSPERTNAASAPTLSFRVASDFPQVNIFHFWMSYSRDDWTFFQRLASMKRPWNVLFSDRWEVEDHKCMLNPLVYNTLKTLIRFFLYVWYVDSRTQNRHHISFNFGNLAWVAKLI